MEDQVLGFYDAANNVFYRLPGSSNQQLEAMAAFLNLTSPTQQPHTPSTVLALVTN